MKGGGVTDFQRRSSEIGRAFEEACRSTLRGLGFTLLGPGNIEAAGIKVDEVAVNRRDKRVYFEFKGSYVPPEPGLIRTDTTKKALCNAFLMHQCKLSPFIIITSHRPKEGSSSDKMVKAARDVIFDLLVLGDVDDMSRLRSLLDMDDFLQGRSAKSTGTDESDNPSKVIPDTSAEEAVAHQALLVRLIAPVTAKTKEKRIRDRKEARKGPLKRNRVDLVEQLELF